MYAVVAPGFSCVYTNWKDVERIKALYPYPKWCKCQTESEAHEFIRRNSYGKSVKQLYNYGDTFSDLFVDIKYRIGPDCVYYMLDTKRVGNLRLPTDRALVEYKGNRIYVKIPDIYLSDESIAGHMSAIYNILALIGNFVDVNIELPNYSIFYCLTAYSRGNNHSVKVTRDFINERLCKVAYTLKMRNYGDDVLEEVEDNGTD